MNLRILVGTNSPSECGMNLYDEYSFSLLPVLSYSPILSLSYFRVSLLGNLKDRPVFRNFSFAPTAMLVCLLVTRNGQTMSVATRGLWNSYRCSILDTIELPLYRVDFSQCARRCARKRPQVLQNVEMRASHVRTAVAL